MKAVRLNGSIRRCVNGGEEDMFKKLPEELVLNILLRLPVKPLGRLKCASKSWRSFINNPQFVREHVSMAKYKESNYQGGLCLLSYASSSNLNNFSLLVKEEDESLHLKHLDLSLDFNPRHVWISGYCDGLVCLSTSSETLVIWNPSIKEYRTVPFVPRLNKNATSASDVGGLGYDPLTDDYKIVRFPSCCPDYGPIEDVQVFALKTNSWRTIQDKPFSYLDYPEFADGIFDLSCTVNGSPHWMEGCWTENVYVIYFDAGEECFGEMPLPVSVTASKTISSWEQWNGCLSLCSTHISSHVEVWVMKEYGVGESWNKLLTVPWNLPPISSFLSVEHLCFTQHGNHLLKVDENFCVKYNPKDGTFRECKLCHDNICFQYAPYVESLVSLKGGATATLR